MSVNTLVLDIEGTVCPIMFVKETLFPYFLAKLPLVLELIVFPLGPSDDPSDDPIVTILYGLDEEVRTSKDSVLEHFQSLVARDIKDPVLKSLQGFIWKSGYESGELKAPVYSDSIEYIREFLSKEGNRIFIYSSGSIKAQILLFGYVDDNGTSVDLNPCLSGYFDITTAGFKQDSSSYTKILVEIGSSEATKQVLFLSDNVHEVKAAISAGMQSKLVIRPGNAPVSKEDLTLYEIIHSLEELS